MLRPLILCAALLLSLSSLSFAQKTIEIQSVPKNMEEFINLRNEISQDADGGSALFIIAMMMYMEDETLGKHAFTVAIDRGNLVEDPNGYKGYAPGNGLKYHLNRLSKEDFRRITHSYIKGTSSKNNYTLPKGSIKVVTTWNKYSKKSNGDIRLFVACSGAATPRPITMRKNNRGLWKVENFSSYFLGVVAPPVDDGL